MLWIHKCWLITAKGRKGAAETWKQVTAHYQNFTGSPVISLIYLSPLFVAKVEILWFRSPNFADTCGQKFTFGVDAWSDCSGTFC